LVPNYLSKSSLGLLAVTVLAVGVITPVAAQTTTTLQPKVAIRPLTRGDIEDREDIADWGMQKSRLTRIAVQKD
jgi:hypothetical protein